MSTDEIVCKWHNIYLYQILWGRPESTVHIWSLRLRTIIVQLFTIKIIPDRIHGVYQLQ
jgi:hypothetical protein